MFVSELIVNWLKPLLETIIILQTFSYTTGAIGGAYWGIEAIPDEWIDCCEATETARKLGDDLYDLVIENKTKK